MSVLPDILAPNLDVVFCGTAVGKASASRGHYYSGPGNKFWQLLHEAGFTATRLRPEDDVTLPALGLGITDLVKMWRRITTEDSTSARPGSPRISRRPTLDG
jgi:TDG/mug DNA glycosylase family protein